MNSKPIITERTTKVNYNRTKDTKKESPPLWDSEGLSFDESIKGGLIRSVPAAGRDVRSGGNRFLLKGGLLLKED